MPTACVLDVGHGNAGLAYDEEHAFVIDAPPGDTVLRALEARGITAVDALLLSHADDDHVGGAAPLLAAKEIDVRNVHVNPDPSKRVSSRQRDLFLAALDDAQGSGRTLVATQINAALGNSLSAGDIVVE